MATSKKSMSETEWKLLANIGDLFKELRVEAGLTQRQAAAKIGTSQARIPVLERGQTDIMITTLNRWAEIYGYWVEVHLIPIGSGDDETDVTEVTEETEENAA